MCVPADLRGQKWAMDPPRTGVTEVIDHCELLRGFWDSNLGPLEMQPVLHASLLFNPVFVFRPKETGFEDDTVKPFSDREGNKVWDLTLEENQILWSHQLGKAYYKTLRE